MTIEELVKERQRRWEKERSAEKDRRFTAWAAEQVLKEEPLRKQVADKPYLLIELCMQVVDKRRRTVPFFWNEVQRDFVRQFETHGTERPYFVLKGRQQGFTTLITAIQLCYCLVRKNFAGCTVADSIDNVDAIFADKAKTLYRLLPDCLKPHEKYNSRRELYFDALGSTWRVDAASENMGRSRTLYFVHYSEVAFYRCELRKLQGALGEALTQTAVQVFETTANGWNEAKDLWDSGTCVNLFYPWWKTKEYRSRNKQGLERQDAFLRERLKWLATQGLDEEQLNWYANKYASYLDKSSIRQEYPCSAEEAFVMSSDSEFGRDAVLDRLNTLTPEKDRVGYFACKQVYGSYGEEWIADWHWVDDPQGCIRLHEEPETRVSKAVLEWHPYALGGDTAGEGCDRYAAKVVSAIDMHTVATLHAEAMDDDEYAKQVYCLGRYYNNAKIGIEINFSLQPTRLLEKWGYDNLYRRERMDSATKTLEKRTGFATTSVTRPVILAELKRNWRENNRIECDKATLMEMMSFVKNDHGRPEAARGQHDDLVMALAIAHHVAGQTDRVWIEQENEEDDWIAANFCMKDNA